MSVGPRAEKIGTLPAQTLVAYRDPHALMDGIWPHFIAHDTGFRSIQGRGERANPGFPARYAAASSPDWPASRDPTRLGVGCIEAGERDRPWPALTMSSLGSSNAKRRGLLAAVRDRMRSGARARATEAADSDERPVAPRAADAPSRSAAPDDELEQVAAEARYHRDRLALYRARMHGAVAGTSLTRLRELERNATAARERLRHARRARSSSHSGE